MKLFLLIILACFSLQAEHNVGPALTRTVEIQSTKETVLKGISVNLRNNHSVVFDTELLRFATGNDQRIKSPNKEHAARVKNNLWATYPLPGWSQALNLDDPRQSPYGPLPRDWAKYKGFYRHGDKIIFHYTLGRNNIYETVDIETHQGQQAFTRTIQLTGKTSEDTLFSIADRPGLDVEILSAKKQARAFDSGRKTAPLTIKKDEVVSVSDKGSNWQGLIAGAPQKNDLIDSKKLTFKSYKDGKRLYVDLGKAHELQRIHTYAKGSQSYQIWTANAEGTNPDQKHIHEGGWVRLGGKTYVEGNEEATVNALTNSSGSLGKHRYILIELLKPMKFHEIDIFGMENKLPELQSNNQYIDKRELLVSLAGVPNSISLMKSPGGRILGHIKAGTGPCTFKVIIGAHASNWPPAKTSPAKLCYGGKSLWPEKLQKSIDTSKAKKAYVVDTIGLPTGNPWGSEIYVGAFDFFSDNDRVAICTWEGDVWIGSGLKEFKNISWKRFAAGLFQPLGLKIVDDVIYINERSQITRLHDLNNNGEADYYENFNNDILITKNFHEFSFDLQTDQEGNFYFSKAGPVPRGGRKFEKTLAHHGALLKLSADGKKLDVYATGMRAPNGIAVSPNGQITASDNEGTWTARCKLHWLKPGSFQGVKPLAHQQNIPDTYNKPLCWLPMDVDNSGGGQVWIDSDRWGPFKGDLLYLSYGQSSLLKIMHETVNGQVQGGAFRIPVNLLSGAMRGRFHKGDGQLYISGLRGWQTNAAKQGALQRVRYTGNQVAMPLSMKVKKNGLLLSFTTELDQELAEDPASYTLRQWNYVWGPMYGSPKISVRNPDTKIVAQARVSEMKTYSKEDTLVIKSAKLLADGKSVFVEVEDLRPAMQSQLKLDLETKDGDEIFYTISATIHEMSEK